LNTSSASPPPNVNRRPLSKLHECPARGTGTVPVSAGRDHLPSATWKMCRSLKALSRYPPPKTRISLDVMAVAVWPARGLGGVPSTCTCSHVRVSRFSTWTSLTGPCSVPPAMTIIELSTRVAVWPARGLGGVPLVAGCGGWYFVLGGSLMFAFKFVLCFVLCVCVCVCVLFCFVLFSLVSVLLCFVLFCFVLFCFVLFCFVLFCFVLFSLVLFCFV
jgi:hypothetical protein